MPTVQALIVGAGPTGMAAAIELRRAGLEVRIIDKATHLANQSQASSSRLSFQFSIFRPNFKQHGKSESALQIYQA